MKFSDSYGTNGELNNDFFSLYIKLLNSETIKFSDFIKNVAHYKDQFKNKGGVYHFYSKSERKTTSLYIGKGGFGKNRKWDLYERLKQHMQASHKKNILTAIANDFACSNKVVIELLMNSSVYFQFVIIYDENDLTENSENKLINFEYYCKKLLCPKYTAK